MIILMILMVMLVLMILIILFFFNFFFCVIRFTYVPTAHSGGIISNVLYNFLMDWNIDRKVSTMIVDNCAGNDAIIG